MLIDCGSSEKKTLEKIKNYLTAYSVDVIDYFILTHPDSEHVGNAVELLKDFRVGKLFMPYISDEKLINFPEMQPIFDYVDENKIEYEISDYSKYVKGENYSAVFLSPQNKAMPNSEYQALNSDLVPSKSDKNNSSAVIYLQAYGCRFLFTGDSGKAIEETIVDRCESGVYDFMYLDKGIKVNLKDIDYLKISDHGSNGASGSELLNYINPKIAMLSVGGNNFEGLPSSEVLERIYTVNPDCKIYRTDVSATIVVHGQNENLQISFNP
jgi:beta-lactamase superfamily II metal-dependent hydrolase